ncbi:MAG: Acylphosphatase [Chloroflexi bacterium ADurb.Bin120]|jgi:acylphosphatase|uniref:Acylphosphatase n=1 Tax=Candidatus Brevifilum fermentans TaxID=1986204 RepID=A0A1Y6K1W4_9CHLR|nr:acylphosphatase [Brevefilum fermentans]MDI9565530.1 acylphosphatase [Chloroflexota bacterium]OQB88108.1 MAG: Acylphosphatase [Chloroflexi bacterium ADurb.Bin120]SMX53546.1 Acylphosphatase [Brevefilum fermentans]HOM67061.1 acylphosphatase [Brevefilum fermentans]
MNEHNIHRLHVHVEGMVQGVGFRYFVLRSAQKLGLTGWVRNRYDGRVEVMAEGTLTSLNRLLQELRRGPQSSEVWNVDYQFEDARGDFERFSVLSTG